EGNHDCPGIVPRAIEELFKQAADSNHTFHITFSMLEIYMGHLRDLLIPQQMRKPLDLTTQSLSIQTDPSGGVEIENLVEIRVSNFNQANKLYGLGSRFRSTASTNSNPTSSRSHCGSRYISLKNDSILFYKISRASIQKQNELLQAKNVVNFEFNSLQVRGLNLDPPYNEHLEALHRIPETNDNTENKIVQEATVTPSSPLPTFMQPTICSKRRSGIDFTKECSIAKTTYLADYETEYSHTASECEIKTVVLPKQGKPKMGFTRSEARNGRYESTKASRIGLSKCLTVENWLQIHNNEPTTCNYNRGNKRVFAIPLPSVKNRCSDWTKIDILHQDKMHNHEFAEKESCDHDKTDKIIDMGVIDDDFVTESNTSSPYSKLKVMNKIPGSMDDFVVNEDRFSPTSPLDISFDRSIQNEDCCGKRERLTEHALEDKENLGDKCMEDRSRYNTSSGMDKTNYISQNRDSTEPVSKSAFELENLSLNTETLGEAIMDPEIKVVINQKAQTEDLVSDRSMTGEECEEKDLHEFPPYMELDSTARLHTMQSQGALNLDLNDDAGQEDSIISVVESQENTGILNLLGQKVQILRDIALLGLGVQRLGLEHNFFYGLMQ
ncbi:hypothetical protein MKX01_001334, partial [Papaver californicum]